MSLFETVRCSHARTAPERENEVPRIPLVTPDQPMTAQPQTLAIHDYTAELQERRAVSETTYRRALDYWGVVGVVELTALIGYYTMVAMTLNAHDFPLPEGVEPPFDQLPCEVRETNL